MSSKIIRLTKNDSKLLDSLMAIYSEALPLSEQKTRAALSLMLGDANYYFYVLSINNNILGFAIIYSPENNDYCLLEYMAIDISLRNGGHGGKLFDELALMFSHKNILIEIESPYQTCPDQATRQRRMLFYMRHNSQYIKNLNYILPLNTAETPPDMLLLLHSKYYQNFIAKEKLQIWLTDIYVKVYGHKKDDARIKQMLDKLPDELELVT